MRVTPPPEALVRGDVLAGVRARAEMVADALGLNGAALLDALMHADTADLVLIEANAIPDLSPSSDLYQQARPRLSLDCLAYSHAVHIALIPPQTSSGRRGPNPSFYVHADLVQPDPMLSEAQH